MSAPRRLPPAAVELLDDAYVARHRAAGDVVSPTALPPTPIDAAAVTALRARVKRRRRGDLLGVQRRRA